MLKRVPTFGLTPMLATVVWVIVALSVAGLIYGLLCLDGFDSNLLAEGVGLGVHTPSRTHLPVLANRDLAEIKMHI